MSEQRAALVRLVTLASTMSRLWDVTLAEAMGRTLRLTYAATGKPLTETQVKAMADFTAQVERVAETMGLPLAQAAGMLADVATATKQPAPETVVATASQKVH